MGSISYNLLHFYLSLIFCYFTSCSLQFRCMRGKWNSGGTNLKTLTFLIWHPPAFITEFLLIISDLFRKRHQRFSLPSQAQNEVFKRSVWRKPSQRCCQPHFTLTEKFQFRSFSFKFRFHLIQVKISFDSVSSK